MTNNILFLLCLSTDYIGSILTPVLTVDYESALACAIQFRALIIDGNVEELALACYS